jgi:hypothetical protein
MNDAIRWYSVVVLVSVPTVMFGGFSLLRLLVRGRLNEFQHSWFRAGHAHAGVLLVTSLATLDIMARAGVGTGWCWVIGAILIIGVLAQSGGMFVHLMKGAPGRWSSGNTLSVAGAVVLATSLILAAIQVATA